ncbi:hypothetical protein FACS189419_02580 [Planctomycetales bacterium]|nr:hypothetical protein FACS189419_02580 [Planctomycetales bacterium]
MVKKTSKLSNDTLLYQAAKEAQDFFEGNGWKFAFIGGLSLLRWGHIRTTQDVDGTLLTLFENEERYIDEVFTQFQPRYPNAREFALQNRVLLLKASNGVGIDFSLGGLPFEQQLIERSSYYEFDVNYVLRTCSAEDLIISKSFAARDKDWGDVRSILQRQKGKLDTDYILSHLQILCGWKEAPEIVEKYKAMIYLEYSGEVV